MASPNGGQILPSEFPSQFLSLGINLIFFCAVDCMPFVTNQQHPTMNETNRQIGLVS